MSENCENALASRLVYVCGKDSSSGSQISVTLKEKLILDLSCRCFVRTHGSPVLDHVDTYCAIVSSNAFIFTLNSQTIYDLDCLNQLGVAIAYNIPIISVRHCDYRLPKALPVRFYETKIVDNRSHLSKSSENKSSLLPDKTPVSTLASALISSYDSSIVFSPLAYSTFVNKLFQCLAGLGADRNTSSLSDGSHSEEEDTQNLPNGRSNYLKSKPMQITGVNPAKARNRRSPQGNKLSKVDDIYGTSSGKLLNRQKSVSHRKIGPSGVKSATSVGLSSHSRSAGIKSYELPSRKIHTEPPPAVRRDNSLGMVKIEINTKEDASKVDDVGESVQTIEHAKKPPEQNTADVETTAGNEANGTEVPTAVADKGLLMPKDDKHKRILRRFSSLPVVPTQYLVASEKGAESPRILSYPPPSESHLSVCSDSPLLFSGDEGDFVSVHLSRTCSPLEGIENEVRADLLEESSR